MTIAIITIAYGENYGNRLQNYAMQELLRGTGFHVVTLRHRAIKNGTLQLRLTRSIKNIIKGFFGRPYDRIPKVRTKRFKTFNRDNIVFSKEKLGNSIEPNKLNDSYDYFIIGSDQVWNTNHSDISSNISNFLATFASPEKRISYAASFGTSQIADGYDSIFKEELPKFKAISVRENEGVKLVEECGATATVVLDPTMMLTAEEWDKLAAKPEFVKDEPFMVTYFLGGRDEKMNEYISAAAQGRIVIQLDAQFTAREKIENLEAFTAPPDEFVWLFAHADCVLTDSFHGSVFSILYHRPFMVFDRLVKGKKSGMESRIDTLLSTFHLEHCRGDINNPIGEPVGGDWDEVERILSIERKRSLDFLKTALDLPLED